MLGNKTTWATLLYHYSSVIIIIIIIIISCYLSFKLKQLNECIQLDLLKNMEKKMQDIRPLWVDKAEYGWIITARKIGFTQIYSLQIWSKKVQTRSKSKAKMVNTAFARQFTWGCNFEGKCGIYHLCLLFNLSLHFFAPILHWVNLM